MITADVRALALSLQLTLGARPRALLPQRR